MGPRFLLYVAFIVAKMHKWRVIHNRSIQLSTLSTWMDCSNHKSNAFLRGLLRRTTSKNASNFRKRYFCETQVGLWGCAWSYAWDIGHSSISKIYSLPLRTEKEKDDDSRFYHTCHKSLNIISPCILSAHAFHFLSIHHAKPHPSFLC